MDFKTWFEGEAINCGADALKIAWDAATEQSSARIKELEEALKDARDLLKQGFEPSTGRECEQQFEDAVIAFLRGGGFTRLPDVCDEQVWVGPGVPEEDGATLKQIMTNAPEGN